MLLILTGVFTAGWGAVENIFHNNWLQILLAVALGGTSLWLGVLAIFKRHDNSILLWLVFAVVVLGVLLGLLFGFALLLGG